MRSVYAFMYCSKTDPSIRSLWQATTRTSDGNGTWYQITSLASGGCLAAIKDSLYVQANCEWGCGGAAPTGGFHAKLNWTAACKVAGLQRS